MVILNYIIYIVCSYEIYYYKILLAKVIMLDIKIGYLMHEVY
jgi:hypothetical protein